MGGVLCLLAPSQAKNDTTGIHGGRIYLDRGYQPALGARVRSGLVVARHLDVVLASRFDLWLRVAWPLDDELVDPADSFMDQFHVHTVDPGRIGDRCLGLVERTIDRTPSRGHGRRIGGLGGDCYRTRRRQSATSRADTSSLTWWQCWPPCLLALTLPVEGCQSGRMGRPRKSLWPPGHRGFESLTFRFSSPGPPFEAASTAFLESCCSLRVTEGSNPSPSARSGLRNCLQGRCANRRFSLWNSWRLRAGRHCSRPHRIVFRGWRHSRCDWKLWRVTRMQPSDQMATSRRSMVIDTDCG